jgi:hypothetical protein
MYINSHCDEGHTVLILQRIDFSHLLYPRDIFRIQTLPDIQSPCDASSATADEYASDEDYDSDTSTATVTPSRISCPANCNLEKEVIRRGWSKENFKKFKVKLH